MEKYKIKIEPVALADIQDITDWYNEKKEGLGKRFQETAIKQINSLNKDPRFMLSAIKKSGVCLSKNFHTWCISILTKMLL